MKSKSAVLILILYLFLVGFALYVMDYHSKPAIEAALILWVPWTLRLNLLLLLAGLLFMGLTRQRPVSPSPPAENQGNIVLRWLAQREVWFLILLFIVAFLSVLLIPPQVHRLFYDEDIYANIGQNIALLNQAALTNYGVFEYGDYQGNWLQYNKEPNGWPFLISLVFQVFGANESYAFLLNNLLFAGSVLIVYLIIRRLTPKKFPAILGGLIYAVIPHNLIWSNTAAAEPSAAFFSGLTVLFFLTWLRSQKIVHLFLLVVTLPLACQMRPESGLIVIWSMAAILILSPGTIMKRRVWAMGLLTALFLLPHLLHLYAMSGQSWGAEGVKFSAGYFLNNLRVNGPYYINNSQFPVFVTLLALAGCLRGKGTHTRSMLISIWFLLFWGIFLFFYAGSYRYGTDVRFALVTFMPLAILAGLGGGKLSEIVSHSARLDIPERYAAALIILVLLFSWISFLPMIRTVGQEAWAARFDHLYARDFAGKIPARSIVLTHNPGMFLLWERSAVQSHIGLTKPELVRQLMDKYPGHVYFHFNFWCNTVQDPNQKLCTDIMEAYTMEAVATAQEQNYHYGLYRMHKKGK